MAVDFAIPQEGLKLEEGLAAASEPLTGYSRKDQHEKAKMMTEFYKKNEVANMISRLTAVLMRDKPADPIAHVLQHLLNPEVGVKVCDDVSPYMNDATAEYLLQNRVHYMFDEFLSNMVDDAPVDEDGTTDLAGYALTWMRWNKKRFSSRSHSTAGQRAGSF